jgi:hypothetical protein
LRGILSPRCKKFFLVKIKMYFLKNLPENRNLFININGTTVTNFTYFYQSFLTTVTFSTYSKSKSKWHLPKFVWFNFAAYAVWGYLLKRFPQSLPKSILQKFVKTTHTARINKLFIKSNSGNGKCAHFDALIFKMFDLNLTCFFFLKIKRWQKK